MDKPDPNILPAAHHAEKVVLGCMLLDAEAINVALEQLQAHDFALDSHQRIFRAIMELAEVGNPVDLTTLRVELERKKELVAVGNVGYLADLTDGIPRQFNIESYVKIIKDKSLLRQVIGICYDGQTRAADQSEDARLVVAEIEEQLLELAHEDTARGFVQLIDEVNAAGGVDPYVAKMTDPAEMTGLSIGFKELDKMFGGLKRGELIIFGARPSMGKTALGLCAACNVVIDDPEAVVPIFSLEMAYRALHRRLLASQAQVNLRRALEGWLGREEKTRLASAAIRFADKHLLIDDTPAITLTKMRAKCRRLKQKHGRLDLILVDYLQLMGSTGKFGSRQQEVGSFSRGLKAMAKELDVPVVALAQVGRGSEQRTGDKRPMLSDLREAGDIEADADLVAFIHRAEVYASEDDDTVERGIAEIIVAKSRDGPTGTRKLAYLADYTLFANLDPER